jgi:hypothetical protein
VQLDVVRVVGDETFFDVVEQFASMEEDVRVQVGERGLCVTDESSFFA